MHPLSGLSVAFFASLLVVLTGLSAYRDEFFFVSQMIRRGFRQGFPFVVHGGMWSDLLIISPILSTTITVYGGRWSFNDWALALFAGIAVSMTLHFALYLRSGLPGFWGYDGRLTTAGWFHVTYTAYALAVFALLYFATSDVEALYLITVSFLLCAHIFVSQFTQLLANLFAPEWFPDQSYRYLLNWLPSAAIWGFICARTLAIIHAHAL